MTELPENWQEELEAELAQMSDRTARLNRLAARPARADIMSSSPGRYLRCIYCGREEYELGWGCHNCGMAAPGDETP